MDRLKEDSEMTIGYICLLICMLLPIFWAGVSKYGYSEVKYDNESPRDHLAELSGKAKNAYNAEQNCYETFPAFAAAVIISHQIGNDQSMIDLLCVVFLLSRFLHGYFYITCKGSLRSIVFVTGLVANIWLFFA
tara:strand:- start:308 stop:709 length:402 start_codon:yes stop_codon:yes gene_type:complete